MKATNLKITPEYINRRFENYQKAGYPNKPMWMSFAEWFLERGYTVTLYEARKTVSKYVTLRKGKKEFKVRFSNHAPIYQRELSGDCDFFCR